MPSTQHTISFYNFRHQIGLNILDWQPASPKEQHAENKAVAIISDMGAQLVASFSSDWHAHDKIWIWMHSTTTTVAVATT